MKYFCEVERPILPWEQLTKFFELLFNDTSKVASPEEAISLMSRLFLEVEEDIKQHNRRYNEDALCFPCRFFKSFHEIRWKPAVYFYNNISIVTFIGEHGCIRFQKVEDVQLLYTKPELFSTTSHGLILDRPGWNNTDVWGRPLQQSREFFTHYNTLQKQCPE